MVFVYSLLSSCSLNNDEALTKEIYNAVLKEALLDDARGEMDSVINSCLVLLLGAKNDDFRLEVINQFFSNNKALERDNFKPLPLKKAATYEKMSADLAQLYGLQHTSYRGSKAAVKTCMNDLGFIIIFIPYLNKERNKCIVLLEHLETAGKGYGAIVILEKGDLDWIIVETYEAWVS
ncbi:MAG: hypothetical protein AAFO07_12920 [Bacteroidota bacterium]